jgi:hypothetical protein
MRPTTYLFSALRLIAGMPEFLAEVLLLPEGSAAESERYRLFATRLAQLTRSVRRRGKGRRKRTPHEQVSSLGLPFGRVAMGA